MRKKQFTLAGPSFVVPGPIPENVEILQKYVQEIGLTFFDTIACLDYSERDLPPSLADLGIKFHIHLPLDLDWSMGANHVFDITRKLMDKAEFLSPDKFVLHPPEKVKSMEKFAELWYLAGYAPESLLLENIRTSDLSCMWPVIESAGLGICLDTGHIQAYGQHDILENDLVWERTSLIHLYGREDHTGHVPLPAISESGKLMLRRILESIPEKTTVLLEVFNIEDFLDSRSYLTQMADPWGMEFV